jgi:hypothetical protein
VEAAGIEAALFAISWSQWRPEASNSYNPRFGRAQGRTLDGPQWTGLKGTTNADVDDRLANVEYEIQQARAKPNYVCNLADFENSPVVPEGINVLEPRQTMMGTMRWKTSTDRFFSSVLPTIARLGMRPLG